MDTKPLMSVIKVIIITIGLLQENWPEKKNCKLHKKTFVSGSPFLTMLQIYEKVTVV